MNFHDNMNESNNKIICNYLPQTLTDSQFHDLFSKYGTIIQSNIVRSKNNYSYGFGFVTFANSQDADRAIAELNGLELKNKKIKVAYSRPQGDDIKKAKLYIKNVPQISVEKLNEIFSKYGTIIQSNIATNKGIAFILYDKREQAEKAIESMNDAILVPGSLPIKIKFATSNNNNNNHQNLRQMRPQYNYSNNGNNYNRQSQFQNNNNNYNLTNHSRPKNNYQNSNYQNSSTSSNYYDRMQTDDYNNTNNQYNKGRNNNFQYSNKSSNRYNPINMNKNYNQNSNNYQIPTQPQYDDTQYDTTNRNNYQSNVSTSNDNILFVYNIGMNTEEQLFNLFSKFGQILKSNVLRKKNLAFIQMSNYDDCLNAIENLNEYILNGCKLQVSFKK